MTDHKCVIHISYALSFYVTKTVLVGPKWFWSKLWFILVENHNFDLTNSFWSWPNHHGQAQINLVRSKPFWTDQNCFGHIEWQGISKHQNHDFSNYLYFSKSTNFKNLNLFIVLGLYNFVHREKIGTSTWKLNH